MTVVDEIPIDELSRKLRSDANVDVIDIREADAFADGHIPDAENVPVAELEDVVADREWADEVAVACYVGETSIQAARLIDAYAESSRVASVAGGFEAWESEVETES